MIEDSSMSASVVMVTRFDAPTVKSVLFLRIYHMLLHRRIAQMCPGLISVSGHISLRERRLWSVSLWTSLEAVFDLGNVKEHVAASRWPRSHRVSTTCGVYFFEGEWKEVMFGAGRRGVSPSSVSVDDGV